MTLQTVNVTLTADEYERVRRVFNAPPLTKEAEIKEHAEWQHHLKNMSVPAQPASFMDTIRRDAIRTGFTTEERTALIKHLSGKRAGPELKSAKLKLIALL